MPRIILNVAEKPSVARSLTDVLSRGGGAPRREGGGGMPLFSFPYTLPGVGAVEMRMTSVAGHVMELIFEGGRYQKWGGCTPLELFDAPVVESVQQGKEGMVAQLKREARAAHVRDKACEGGCSGGWLRRGAAP